jgi:hypothetical protein
MVRRFSLEGREWDVESTERSESVSSGPAVGQPTGFGVGFRRVGSDPGDEIFGRLGQATSPHPPTTNYA